MALGVFFGSAMALLTSPTVWSPPMVAPGRVDQQLTQPSATPWASLFFEGRAALPGGDQFPPPNTPTATPTPTATATPTPTATPEPTWTPEPVYIPPEPEEPAYVPPAPSGGDWVSIVCSYAWSCDEALNVIHHESRGDPWATNPSSGACGLFQLFPCPPGGYDVWTNVAIAWGKYTACGHSFSCAWYAWW